MSFIKFFPIYPLPPINSAFIWPLCVTTKIFFRAIYGCNRRVSFPSISDYSLIFPCFISRIHHLFRERSLLGIPEINASLPLSTSMMNVYQCLSREHQRYFPCNSVQVLLPVSLQENSVKGSKWFSVSPYRSPGSILWGDIGCISSHIVQICWRSVIISLGIFGIKTYWIIL